MHQTEWLLVRTMLERQRALYGEADERRRRNLAAARPSLFRLSGARRRLAGLLASLARYLDPEALERPASRLAR